MAYIIQRLPEVLRARGRSRTAHYMEVQQRLFTRPVRIGVRSVGWPSNETEAINAATKYVATHRPDSLRAMREIHGVGDAKLERYGSAFLEVIRNSLR